MSQLLQQQNKAEAKHLVDLFEDARYSFILEPQGSFVVNVNGRKSRPASSLEVADPRPLEIRNPYGQQQLEQLHKTESVYQNGKFDIIGFAYLPDRDVLSKTVEGLSLNIAKLCEPKYNLIDGKMYRNLDFVTVSEFTGKVKQINKQ